MIDIVFTNIFIVENFNNYDYDFNNDYEDDFNDYDDDTIQSAIENYISQYSNEEIKEYVDNYGIFKAIRLTQDRYDGFEAGINDETDYSFLFFCIVNVIFDDRYDFKHIKETIHIHRKSKRNKSSDIQNPNTRMSDFVNYLKNI
tara:strand:- start:1422 stop:1853 length:432 start_codon:yes stop_codon:yes gene_type:complete